MVLEDLKLPKNWMGQAHAHTWSCQGLIRQLGKPSVMPNLIPSSLSLPKEDRGGKSLGMNLGVLNQGLSSPHF